MKKYILILLTILLVGITPLYGCGSSKEQTKAGEEALKDELIASQFAEIAEKYQAVTNWEEDCTYTLQVQERLITDKPVLFREHVDDVFGRDGKTFVRFSPNYSLNINYQLELECNNQILQKLLHIQALLSQNSNDWIEYAVVANIQEVYKPAYEISAYAISKDEAEIDIVPSDILIIKGNCLDVVSIRDGN